jgi:hypothetical protein
MEDKSGKNKNETKEWEDKPEEVIDAD